MYKIFRPREQTALGKIHTQDERLWRSAGASPIKTIEELTKMAKKKKSKTAVHKARSKNNGSSTSSTRNKKTSSFVSSTLTSSAAVVPVFVAMAVAGGFFGHHSFLHSNSNNAHSPPYSQSYPTDPWVDIIPNVMPSSTCIDIMKRSEKIGYRLFPDSIDEGEPDNLDQQAQEIYIYHKKQHGIVEPTLYELIQPHLYKLTNAIKDRRELLEGSKFVDDTSFVDPSIEWIFLRKYYPLGKYSKRNSLKVHTDSNMHSFTLALNDNYEGGGLFVVRPKEEENSTTTTTFEEDTPTTNNKQQDGSYDYYQRPKVPVEYSGYKWLQSLTQRQNSSKVFFPELKQGSAAMINFTVPHGVAPLAEESRMPRYALIVFYDMESYYKNVFPLLDQQQS